MKEKRLLIFYLIWIGGYNDCKAAFKKVDILVNNAGVAGEKNWENTIW